MNIGFNNINVFGNFCRKLTLLSIFLVMRINFMVVSAP